MLISDIEGFRINDALYYPIDHLEEIDGKCCINNKIALPIIAISSCYNQQEDLPIYDQDSNYLGMICFCKNVTDLDKLTEWQFIGYLTEVDISALHIEKYQFSYDYMVIDKNMYEEYMTIYYETAAIWGRFHHIDNIPEPHKINITRITAISNLNFPTSYHKENAIRAIKEPYSFERFLKFYHLLELLFDYELVNQIKSIGDDLKGIGKILNDYKREDINRLKSVIGSKYIDQDDYSKLIIHLNKGLSYPDKCTTIFFDFGKEKNPLNIEEFNKIVVHSFDYTKLKSPVLNKIKTQEDFNSLVLDTAIYWIYRIRCCIAHNKIGEYVMTHDDEEFIAEFGEQLLLAVLVKCLRSDN